MAKNEARRSAATVRTEWRMETSVQEDAAGRA
jgi:hypothetical protein